jgi:hypothetical protein
VLLLLALFRDAGAFNVSSLPLRCCCCCSDSLMRSSYFALRCLMLDFWDHSLGECSVSSSRHLQKAIYQAADTNVTSAMGSRVTTDVLHCVHLLDGGRICWVHSVRGEEFADPQPQVSC